MEHGNRRSRMSRLASRESVSRRAVHVFRSVLPFDKEPHRLGLGSVQTEDQGFEPFVLRGAEFERARDHTDPDGLVGPYLLLVEVEEENMIGSPAEE